jgi:uncharacterized membrane protein
MARVRAACVLAVVLAACGRPAEQTPPTSQIPETSRSVDAAPATFRCVGNEPGWSLDIRADSLVFVGDYGEIRAAFPAVTPRRGDGVWYWESESRDTPSGSSRLVAVVVADSCSDGMSDHAYGYRARVIYDVKAWIGCADRR